MGAKVMNAAHNIAQMTDFEGHGVKASAAGNSSADGVLGEAMYNRFREFDSKYLQPLFGKSGEHMNVSSELPDGTGTSEDDGQGAEGGGQSHEAKPPQ